MTSYLKYSLFYILLFFTPNSQALLPPKYQETLLCLPAFCLARQETGLLGSKASRYKCQDERSSRLRNLSIHSQAPRPFVDPLVWTSRSGESLLKTLKDNGFHEQRCDVLKKPTDAVLVELTKTSIYT